MENTFLYYHMNFRKIKRTVVLFYLLHKTLYQNYEIHGPWWKGENILISFWEILNAQLWCPWSPLIIVKFMSPGSVVQALRQGQYYHIVKMNWILNLQLNGWLWCPWTLPLKLGNSWPLSQGLGHFDRANMTTKWN